MQKGVNGRKRDERNEFKERLSKIKRVMGILCEHVDESGFMPASLTYPHYSACWFRDASMVSIALSRTAKILKRFGEKEAAEKARISSEKILSFCWKAIEKNMPRIERGISIPFQDKSFFSTENHLPARLGNDMSFFKQSAGDGIKSDEVDNVWLRQYDSLPLVLLATECYIKEFGISSGISNQIHIIKENWEKFLNYMVKVYKTPCYNAWELDGHQLHSYTIASIEKGVDSLHNILLAFGIGIGEEAKLIKAKNEIDIFLRDFFIREEMLCKAKDVFRKDGGDFESEPIREVDASKIIAFNYFKPACVGSDIEENTMKRIDRDLINGNALPIRYLGDTYFYGGRWILLGMEAARWHIAKGNVGKGNEILKYVEDKYLGGNGMLPEQEIVDPASTYDPGEYYKRNGNCVISDLAWSEGAYVLAASEYLESVAKNKWPAG